MTTISRARTVLAALFLCLLFSIKAQAAVSVLPEATGLSAAIGQKYNLADNSIYFVEWTAGTLSKLNLVTHAKTVMHSAFVNPEDVALAPSTGWAYVTTRDGKLWRASLTSAAKSIVASGLGMPHGIQLDLARNLAYIADFTGGRLLEVNLTSGVSRVVSNRVPGALGVLLTADMSKAYVSSGTTINMIEISSGVRTQVITGLSNAFFMDWANDARSAIYFVERDPANKVSILNVSAAVATRTILAEVPSRPSSVVRVADPSVIFVASDNVISRVVLADCGSPGNNGPVITRLGHIPSTEINFASGLATTNPAYFFYVKNASFGGSVHTMLNFPEIRSSGGAYYKITLDGAGPANAEKAAWTNYKWNGTTFVLETVFPDSDGFYTVPSDTDLWAIPDLGFVLDTSPLSNARHVMRVQAYNSAKNPIAGAFGEVALLVDNIGPIMHIDQISHDGVPINECALITSGSPNLQFTFTAFDAQGHLYSYGLTDGWGHGRTASVASDQYIGFHDAGPTWAGVAPRVVNYTLTNTACAHVFTLGGWSNTTNGYSFIHYSSDFETLAVYLPVVGGPGGLDLCGTERKATAVK